MIDATPAAAAPPAGRRHAGRVLVAGMAVLVLAAAAAGWYGAVRPRLEVWAGRYGAEPARGDDAVVLVVYARNRAHGPVRITGAGERVDGLDLDRVELTDARGRTTTGSVMAGPGERVRLTLHYRVYDCDRVPDRAGAIPIGTTTALGLPGLVRGVDSLGTGEFGDPIPWTVALSRPVCPPG